MNKRLRRLLKRRQPHSATSESDQKTKEKQAFSSLLATRPSTKPNYYFRSGSQNQNERSVKESDEKGNDKTLLFVEEVALSNLEDENSEIEISFEPMGNESGGSCPPNQTDVNNSAVTWAEVTPDHIPQNKVSTGRSVQSVTEQRNVSSDQNISSTICLNSRNCKPFHNEISRYNAARERGSNDVSFPVKSSIDTSRNLRKSGNPFNNADHPASDLAKVHCANPPSTTKTAHGSDLPVTRCTQSTPDAPVKVETLLPLGRADPSSRESNSLALGLPYDDATVPGNDLQLSTASENWPRSVCSSAEIKQNCRALNHFQIGGGAPSHDTCARRCDAIACASAARRSGFSNRTSSESESLFLQGHSCRASNQFPSSCQPCRACDCRVACKRQSTRCCSCRSQQPPCCFAHQLEEEEALFAPADPLEISVSIYGDPCARIIQLPFPEEHLQPHCAHRCPSQRCNEDQFCACQRHLEETKSSFCFQDCSVRCKQECMAPTMLLLPNQQEICTFLSETHCPCCHRLLRRKTTCTSSIPDPRRMLPDPHSYENCNSVNTRFSNSLGHFEISQRAYSKLLHFIESKRALLARRPFVNRNEHHQSADRQISECGGEFFFLNRTPTRTFNEYSTPGLKSSTVPNYHNQAVGEMLQLAKVLETVEECPWYWGEVSNTEAKRLLQGTPIGTFLLRDSSDPKYLFSISVMTSRGPTSIRIVYSNGSFRFDSDGIESRNSRRPSSSLVGDSAAGAVPAYRQCVIRMILHYTKHLLSNTSKAKKARRESSFAEQSRATSSDVNVDSSMDTQSDSESGERGHFMCSWMGRNGISVMPVVLDRPRPKKLLSLQQLSRAVVNKRMQLWKNTERVYQLPVPIALHKFVKKYPYPV